MTFALQFKYYHTDKKAFNAFRKHFKNISKPLRSIEEDHLT